MQFEGRRRTTPVPNLTPLIDIVFLLLVFFMLTSHFVREEALNLDLPVAESGQAVEERDQLEIVVTAEGHLLFREHLVEPQALKATLNAALQESDNKVVRIRGDRAVSLGRAVELLDIARGAGAEGVDIVTEQR